MKKNLTFQKKTEISEKRGIVLHFANVGLTVDSRISTSGLLRSVHCDMLLELKYMKTILDLTEPLKASLNQTLRISALHHAPSFPNLFLFFF